MFQYSLFICIRSSQSTAKAARAGQQGGWWGMLGSPLPWPSTQRPCCPGLACLVFEGPHFELKSFTPSACGREVPSGFQGLDPENPGILGMTSQTKEIWWQALYLSLAEPLGKSIFEPSNPGRCFVLRERFCLSCGDLQSPEISLFQEFCK